MRGAFLSTQASKVSKFILQQTLHQGSHERMSAVSGNVPDIQMPPPSEESKSGELEPESIGNRERSASALIRGYTSNMTNELSKQNRNEVDKIKKKQQAMIDSEQNVYIKQTIQEVTGLRSIVRQLQVREGDMLVYFKHRLTDWSADGARQGRLILPRSRPSPAGIKSRRPYVQERAWKYPDL